MTAFFVGLSQGCVTGVLDISPRPNPFGPAEPTTPRKYQLFHLDPHTGRELLVGCEHDVRCWEHPPWGRWWRSGRATGCGCTRRVPARCGTGSASRCDRCNCWRSRPTAEPGRRVGGRPAPAVGRARRPDPATEARRARVGGGVEGARRDRGRGRVQGGAVVRTALGRRHAGTEAAVRGPEAAVGRGHCRTGGEAGRPRLPDP